MIAASTQSYRGRYGSWTGGANSQRQTSTSELQFRARKAPVCNTGRQICACLGQQLLLTVIVCPARTVFEYSLKAPLNNLYDEGLLLTLRRFSSFHLLPYRDLWTLMVLARAFWRQCSSFSGGT